MDKNSATRQGILKALGPGIIFAGSAIGVSHLVQSTRAGATYGYQLLWIIILINLFKYPFFEYGHRYAAATGESLLSGYKKLGKWALVVFFCLIAVTAMINFAAVTIVLSGLTATLFNLKIKMWVLNISLLSVIIIMLVVGRYALLDITMKIIVCALSFLTIVTFFIAFGHSSTLPSDFIPPDPFNKAGILFIIALMGWMPSPLEASVFTSLWTQERSKQTGYRPKFKETMIDFHVGYIGSGVMALFFLGLGAAVMYGSGLAFEHRAALFAKQLVSIYSSTLGAWSFYIISAIAMLTIFSTTLTIIDALPRTLAGSQAQLTEATEGFHKKWYWIWVVALAVAAIIILSFFGKSLMKLLDFATIMTFLAAPVYAIFNYKVVTSDFMPEEYQPKEWLRILSWLGLIFLIGFGLFYIYTRIFW